MANSDFHKPRHIYSWKTLIHCEKDAEVIKDSLCRNLRAPGHAQRECKMAGRMTIWKRTAADQ